MNTLPLASAGTPVEDAIRTATLDGICTPTREIMRCFIP
jgi:hypothetical protein